MRDRCRRRTLVSHNHDEPDRDKEDKRRKEHPQLAPAWPVATTALARRLPLLVFVGTLGPANIARTRTLVNVGIFQR